MRRKLIYRSRKWQISMSSWNGAPRGELLLGGYFYFLIYFLQRNPFEETKKETTSKEVEEKLKSQSLKLRVVRVSRRRKEKKRKKRRNLTMISWGHLWSDRSKCHRCSHPTIKIVFFFFLKKKWYLVGVEIINQVHIILFFVTPVSDNWFQRSLLKRNEREATDGKDNEIISFSDQQLQFRDRLFTRLSAHVI